MRGVANPNTGFICRLLEFGQRIGLPSNQKPMAPLRLYRMSPWYGAPVARPIDGELSAAELDTRSAFVLHVAPQDGADPQALYVWVGARAHEEYSKAAHRWAAQLSKFEGAPPAAEVAQGAEPASFWEALGGAPAEPPAKLARYDNDYGVGKVPCLTPQAPALSLPSSGAAFDAPMRQSSSLILDESGKTARTMSGDILRDDTPADAKSPPKENVAELYMHPEWEELEMFDSDDLDEDGASAPASAPRSAPLPPAAPAAPALCPWSDARPLTSLCSRGALRDVFGAARGGRGAAGARDDDAEQGGGGGARLGQRDGRHHQLPDRRGLRRGDFGRAGLGLAVSAPPAGVADTPAPALPPRSGRGCAGGRSPRG